MTYIVNCTQTELPHVRVEPNVYNLSADEHLNLSSVVYSSDSWVAEHYSGDQFITIQTPSGDDEDQFIFDAPANTGTDTREEIVRVALATDTSVYSLVTISQRIADDIYATPATISTNADSKNIPAAFTVYSTGPWSYYTTDSWITVNPESQEGDYVNGERVDLIFQTNTGTSTRTGTITLSLSINGTTYTFDITVEQTAVVVNPTSLDINGGEHVGLSINVTGTDSWIASCTETFVTITTGSGGDGGNIILNVALNDTDQDRAFTVNIEYDNGFGTLSVQGTQTPAILVTADQTHIDNGGGDLIVSISTFTGNWTVLNEEDIDDMLGSYPSSGADGDVTIPINPNTAYPARQSTLTFAVDPISPGPYAADVTFTQDEADNYVDPPSASVPGDVDSTVQARIKASTDWEAGTSVIVVTPLSGGPGTIDIELFITSNSTDSPRTETIDFIDSTDGTTVLTTFTMNQEAGPTWLNIGEDGFDADPMGGSRQVEVTSSSGWTATTSDSWITITSGTGGNGDFIAFDYTMNDTGADRIGTITATLDKDGTKTDTFEVRQSNFAPALLHYYIEGKNPKADGTVPSDGEAVSYLWNILDPDAGYIFEPNTNVVDGDIIYNTTNEGLQVAAQTDGLMNINPPPFSGVGDSQEFFLVVNHGTDGLFSLFGSWVAGFSLDTDNVYFLVVGSDGTDVTVSAPLPAGKSVITGRYDGVAKIAYLTVNGTEYSAPYDPASFSTDNEDSLLSAISNALNDNYLLAAGRYGGLMVDADRQAVVDFLIAKFLP